MGRHFAAVGTDGTRPVVWGVGHTEDAAREDAKRWLFDYAESIGKSRSEIEPLTVHPISREEYEIVR